MRRALILVALLACAGCANHHHYHSDAGPGAKPSDGDAPLVGPPMPPTSVA